MARADRTGVVLAGGHSTRFGDADKALAPVNDDPMLVRVVRRLATVVDSVVVSCRSDQHDPFASALDAVDPPVPIRFVPDSTPGEGPLAGVSAALEGIDSPRTAVLACDMPWVDPEFLAYLFAQVDGSDAAVPTGASGYLQPTQAVYRTERMQSVAAAQLSSGERSLLGALDELDITAVPADVVEARIGHRTLRDVNTREEIPGRD